MCPHCPPSADTRESLKHPNFLGTGQGGAWTSALRGPPATASNHPSHFPKFPGQEDLVSKRRIKLGPLRQSSSLPRTQEGVTVGKTNEKTASREVAAQWGSRSPSPIGPGDAQSPHHRDKPQGSKQPSGQPSPPSIRLSENAGRWRGWSGGFTQERPLDPRPLPNFIIHFHCWLPPSLCPHAWLRC